MVLSQLKHEVELHQLFSSKLMEFHVAFEQYIEKILAPCLTERQIVLMDNLAAHKSAKAEEVIQARGCQLLFLPSYSPDFSPIEETFSKLKTFLRRAGARTREALQE